MEYSLKDAQKELQKLIEDARQGKIVVILNENQQAVQLVPLHAPNRKPRQAGTARGLIQISDDFDAPLTDFSEYME